MRFGPAGLALVSVLVITLVTSSWTTRALRRVATHFDGEWRASKQLSVTFGTFAVGYGKRRRHVYYIDVTSLMAAPVPTCAVPMAVAGAVIVDAVPVAGAVAVPMGAPVIA